MTRDRRVEAVKTGQPEVQLLACTSCGVIVWDIEAHYAHAHPTCGHPNHGASGHSCTPFVSGGVR